MTKKQRKTLFLANFAKTLNKTEAMKGVMNSQTFYAYCKDDEKFKQEVYDVELSIVHVAESAYWELLKSEDENIKLKTAEKVLNSRLGKRHSELTLAMDNGNEIKINTDNIEYIVNGK